MVVIRSCYTSIGRLLE